MKQVYFTLYLLMTLTTVLDCFLTSTILLQGALGPSCPLHCSWDFCLWLLGTANHLRVRGGYVRVLDVASCVRVVTVRRNVSFYV